MKTNKIPPAFIRYLKPRLQPFSRPLFWGSLSILFLLGVIIYQYGRYSDWLEASSEKVTNSNSISNQNLADKIEQYQFSLEDLAIGADIDNLDLLLQEVNQNQNFSLDLSLNSSEKSAPQNNQDKSLTRFQAKQQARSDRSLHGSNSVSDYQNNSPDRNLINRLKNKNSTLISPLNQSLDRQSVSHSSELMSNPVGSLYLSNRQQNFNSDKYLFKEKKLNHSVNSLTNNNKVLVPVVTNSPTIKDSFQDSAAALITPIDTYKPSEVSSNLLKSQQNNNLTNYQIQPLDFYQLQLSNYQLQPQELEAVNRNTLSLPTTSFGAKEISNQTNLIDFNNSIFQSNNLPE